MPDGPNDANDNIDKPPDGSGSDEPVFRAFQC